MTNSSTSSLHLAEGEQTRPNPFSNLNKYALPAIAFAAMCLMTALTPPRNPVRHMRTTLEWVAHDLGHGLNSVWVGIGLLLLIVPALVALCKDKSLNLWAVRALEAILLDYLFVDLLGKDLFLGLGRPGRPDQPGFPSGHGTMAFLMAWLVWQRYPKLGPLWFAMAAMVGWSRVQSHAHFPYQVVAGALYGCAIGAFVMAQDRLVGSLRRVMPGDGSRLKDGI